MSIKSSFGAFPTSLGLLHISAIDPTFTARAAPTPAPEPAGLALAIGLAGLGFSLRIGILTKQRKVTAVA